MELEQALAEEQSLPEDKLRTVELFKRRMLEYSNPIEFVNNMYGCHPGQDGQDYFEIVFGQQ